MLRSSLGTALGIVVAIAIVAAIEALGHTIYPPPPGIDPNNPDEFAKLIASMPIGALALVVAAWLLGAMGGAAAATWLLPARSALPALIVGAFVTAAVLFMLYSIPHPVWMMVAGIALPLPLAWMTARLVNRSRLAT